MSLGDALAALFAVIGTLAAIHERERSGQGQEVDVAIYEAVFALMESTVADWELAGVLRGRSGGVLPGVAPSNCYPTADGHEVVIAANADAVFLRLAQAMGRPELAEDERYSSHGARGLNLQALDAVIGRWTATLPADELMAVLERSAVPVGLIYTGQDIVGDQHFAAREMVLRLAAAGFDEPVPMSGVVPKLSRTPGRVASVGPELGQHTDAVLRDLAGVGEDELAALRSAGVIA